jgi:DNA invertase Pin-like site-specific DNA recombinase
LYSRKRQNRAKNAQENSLRKTKQHCTLSFIFSYTSKYIMFVGYIRVSKNDGSQTLSPQRDAMLTAGVVESNRIYEDLASGRKDDRPGLTACLKALQPGNTLVVWKLDRLGRDLKHLVITVDELRSRNVGLKVLTGTGAQIDTTSSNGRLFLEFLRHLLNSSGN